MKEWVNMETLKYNEVWIAQRADPYVYRHVDGNYYFTASLPEYDGIALRKADSLEALAQATEVMIWKKHETGPMSYHIWAPELYCIDGRWYIYFAAAEKEDVWKLRPYVLECMGQNPMEDGWAEKGMLQCADDDEFSFRAFSLDVTIFENKGKHFCIWAEKVGVGKQISNLYIAEMESPIKLKTVQELLSTPDYDWERIGFWVNEGPSVIKKNGKIFVTYSASDTGANYCIGMLSINENADLLDPGQWEKKRYPVLKSDESRGIYGPGHNSFTTDLQGNDIMVFHARTEREIVGNPLYNPNRHAMLMKLEWNKEGEPVFHF